MSQSTLAVTSKMSNNVVNDDNDDDVLLRDTVTQLGYDLEVCFCKGNMCNAGQRIEASGNFFSFIFVFIFSIYNFSQ